jgi:hypothetical protein
MSTDVSGISEGLSARSVVGALKRFGGGSNSLEVDLRLTVPACSDLTVGWECCRSLRYNDDHRGGLTQGWSFLPGVAAVDGAMGSSAVCAGDSGREGGAR